MNDEATVVVRPFNQIKDFAFVIATWRNSWYYGVSFHKESAVRSFKKKTAEIKAIVPKADILIACLKDAPETIIGYVVSRGTHLDWIYVKIEFRNMGIANMLVPDGIETVTPHLTKIGEAILNKKNLKKENDNGSSDRDSTEAGTTKKN